jgi:hypothetical protein
LSLLNKIPAGPQALIPQTSQQLPRSLLKKIPAGPEALIPQTSQQLTVNLLDSMLIE